jgi:hypothetical protein
MSESYSKISNRIEVDWYPYHKAEWFSQKDICDFFVWKEATTKHEVSQKLYNDTNLPEPKLEKQGKTYRLIDRNIDELSWADADPTQIIKLILPYGVEDNTHFDFEPNVLIPPKSVIIVAGTSNEGKTTLCLNILVNNMDLMNVIYFTNEMSAVGFKRRMLNFDWVSLFKEDGVTPKWRTVTRYDNYQDVIDPNGLNIIDYLDANEQGEYYKLAPYIKGIHKKLKNGLAVIALQKPPGREDAFGGTNIRGVAALYLSIDKGQLTVVKAKDWVNTNPNGKKYSFEITKSGSQFCNIHDVSEIVI